MTGSSDDQQQTMVVTIGLNQLYDKLMEVQFGVRDINNKLGELAHDSRDHEERLRLLESEDVRGQRQALGELRDELKRTRETVWKLTGGLAVVAPAAGFLLTRIFGA